MNASLPLRVVPFAALAAFAVAHWASLVADAPAGRLLAVTAIACAGAVALALLGDRSRDRAAAVALALAIAGLGLLAAGLAASLLAPSGWDRLADGIGQGFAGLAEADPPYSGQNPWSRLVILLAPPLALGLAAALAFWPGRPRRGWALVVLVSLYAVAVTLESPEQPLLWGAALLVLISAWLWLPGLERRAGRAALAAVAVAGAVGVGAAALLDGDDPWLNWTEWSWPGEQASVGFRWNHSYGPLEWPREGRALLRAESEDPHYWRTIQLDRFDGLRWEVATERLSIERPLELPEQVEGPAAGPPDPEWMEEVTFTLGALDTGLLIAPGYVRSIEGLDGVAPGAGGTSLTSEKLNAGDEYTVTSYVPEPTAARLRAAPAEYPRPLRRYTQLELPRGLPVPEANSGLTLSRPPSLSIPLYGEPVRQGIAARLRSSLYADVSLLARRLSAGAPTAYDAVAAIEAHLRGNYAYDESPPVRPVPLHAFLFEDRAGYCQQFSGAMALMLRTLGIPSRVASGFSSGEREQDGGAFQVSDRDAHSWVEVYFNGIGWVPFEPTPSAAPAGAQLSELASGRRVEATGTVIPRRGLVVPTVAGQITESPSGGGGGAGELLGRLALALALVGAASAALLAALVARRALHYRGLAPDDAAAAQAGELRRALPRLGLPIRAGATLAELERRHAGRAGLADYLARLRASRFGRGRRPPDLALRRTLRRELGADRGLAGRLRALLALPPGGPRR